ncbi:MAG TPA: PqiC family protein [Burkholderiales bacterium]|nr:PqiC family protein [Burkholderiales bacterium]
MKRRGALALLLLALAACATPLPTRYYTLSGELPLPETATSTTHGSRVAIGPVSVPEALDRQQIVLRVAPDRYAISDADRWAEPLKREIPRVLAEDVGRRLPTADVAAYYQFGAQDAKYRVLIDVLRFESVPGKSITLEAAWSVRNRAGARLREARSVFVEKVDAPGIAPLVIAHDKALAALADKIAEAVAGLAGRGIK